MSANDIVTTATSSEVTSSVVMVTVLILLVVCNLLMYTVTRMLTDPKFCLRQMVQRYTQKVPRVRVLEVHPKPRTPSLIGHSHADLISLLSHSANLQLEGIPRETSYSPTIQLESATREIIHSSLLQDDGITREITPVYTKDETWETANMNMAITSDMQNVEYIEEDVRKQVMSDRNVITDTQNITDRNLHVPSSKKHKETEQPVKEKKQKENGQKPIHTVPFPSKVSNTHKEKVLAKTANKDNKSLSNGDNSYPESKNLTTDKRTPATAKLGGVKPGKQTSGQNETAMSHSVVTEDNGTRVKQENIVNGDKQHEQHKHRVNEKSIVGDLLIMTSIPVVQEARSDTVQHLETVSEDTALRSEPDPVSNSEPETAKAFNIGHETVPGSDINHGTISGPNTGHRTPTGPSTGPGEPTALRTGPGTPTGPNTGHRTQTGPNTGHRIPTGPSTRPGTPTGPSTRPGTQTGPSNGPGTPTGPNTGHRPPTGPSTGPGTPTGPNTGPGTPTGPSTGHRTPTGPSTGPGIPTGPRTGPGTPTGPSTGPGTPTGPSTGPGTPTGPSTGPGTPTGLNTGPGTPTGPNTGHRTPTGSSTGPGTPTGPSTGNRTPSGPVTTSRSDSEIGQIILTNTYDTPVIKFFKEMKSEIIETPEEIKGQGTGESEVMDGQTNKQVEQEENQNLPEAVNYSRNRNKDSEEEMIRGQIVTENGADGQFIKEICSTSDNGEIQDKQIYTGQTNEDISNMTEVKIQNLVDTATGNQTTEEPADIKDSFKMDKEVNTEGNHIRSCVVEQSGECDSYGEMNKLTQDTTEGDTRINTDIQKDIETVTNGNGQIKTEDLQEKDQTQLSGESDSGIQNEEEKKEELTEIHNTESKNITKVVQNVEDLKSSEESDVEKDLTEYIRSNTMETKNDVTMETNNNGDDKKEDKVVKEKLGDNDKLSSLKNAKPTANNRSSKQEVATTKSQAVRARNVVSKRNNKRFKQLKLTQ